MLGTLYKKMFSRKLQLQIYRTRHMPRGETVKGLNVRGLRARRS